MFEDETGFSNLVVFQKLFETYRKEILHSRLLMVEGKVQKEGEVVHVILSKCFDFTKLLKGLTTKDDDQLPILTLSRADENRRPTLLRTNAHRPDSILHRKYLMVEEISGNY